MTLGHVRLDRLACVCGDYFGVNEINDNMYRTRTWERCGACGRERYGCRAKRLDAEGRAAWGPPGEWFYSAKEA